jgi:hypothetical protein
MQRVSDVRPTQIHAAKPAVPQPSDFCIETAIEKSKSYKFSRIDQIPAEMIQEGGEIL